MKLPKFGEESQWEAAYQTKLTSYFCYSLYCHHFFFLISKNLISVSKTKTKQKKCILCLLLLGYQMSYNSDQHPATSEGDLAEQPEFEFMDWMFDSWLNENSSSLTDSVMFPVYQAGEVDEFVGNTIHQGEPSCSKHITFITF